MNVSAGTTMAAMLVACGVAVTVIAQQQKPAPTGYDDTPKQPNV